MECNLCAKIYECKFFWVMCDSLVLQNYYKLPQNIKINWYNSLLFVYVTD